MKIPAKKGDKCISDSREELSLYPEDTVGGPGPGYRSPSDHQRNLPSGDRETFYKAIISRHRVRAGGLVDPTTTTTTTITVFTLARVHLLSTWRKARHSLLELQAAPHSTSPSAPPTTLRGFPLILGIRDQNLLLSLYLWQSCPFREKAKQERFQFL